MQRRGFFAGTAAEQMSQAVVVLGMHRGGTSAVAGTVARLGFALPSTPIPPSSENPSGYFESEAVAMANHEILLAAGCSWNICLTFDPSRLRETLRPADRRMITTVLRREFGADMPFVMKDPRLCLTLPAWLPALRAARTDVRALLVIRHPAEVVQSLEKRNGLAPMRTAPHWLHHMLEAERASRGLGRAFVFYDDLLQAWRTCMARAGELSGVAWPRSLDLAGSDIDNFLSRSSRHHVAQSAPAAIGPAPVSEMIRAAWYALMHLLADPCSLPAQLCLDQVHASFAEWRRVTFPPGYRALSTAGQDG